MSTETQSPNIERVGVVGCGQMGAGIAEVCARAGMDVMVHEIDADSAERGRTRLLGSFDKAVARSKMTEEERDETISRLTFTTDLADMADRRMVIEAVIEDEKLKTDVFTTLDNVQVLVGVVLIAWASRPIAFCIGDALSNSQVINAGTINPGANAGGVLWQCLLQSICSG